ncbi:3-keto-disaccharide hydrolase [Mariniblastus fucicola]|nr:DUF1080 domain-containing protein [Mariniblastus fucicola]
MKTRSLIFAVLLTSLCCLNSVSGQTSVPEGFESVFNGNDLDGWYAMPTADPRKFAELSPEGQQARIAELESKTDEFWRVEDGVIINDGNGPYLTTKRNFRDYELLIDFKLEAGGDSGVYLKATPQVQVWDTTHEPSFKHGSEKGSGGLWNNGKGSPARFPTVHADKPVGEWNTMRIQQVGARTSIWLNEKKVVDHQIMDNYWARQLPIIASGPIQLQTHGGKMYWRNIFVRDIEAQEANEILATKQAEKFQSVFNGTDFKGWAGPTDNYEINDGVLRCKPKSGGTIYTEKEYSDFAVRFEFKLPPGGNNGLAIRYPGNGDTAYVGMCELQVLDNTAAQYANLDQRQYHGSAYGMAAAARGYLRPVGEWNFQQVTVVGSTIKVELNGNLILNTDLSKIDSFLADRPHPGKDRTSGHFGFAGHNDPVEFRNVSIKDLSTQATDE